VENAQAKAALIVQLGEQLKLNVNITTIGDVEDFFTKIKTLTIIFYKNDREF